MRTKLLVPLMMVLTTGAPAVTVVSLGPVTGAATGGLTGVSTPFPNNDNELANSPNTLGFGLIVNSIGSINHPLITDGLPGVTEYSVGVAIRNNLGVNITSWTFKLPGTPLDFDFPDFDPGVMFSSLGWTPVIWSDSTLRFQGGILAPGQTMNFIFNVDVPAGNLGFSSEFEVSQTPEPAAWTLVAGALALLGAGGVRRSYFTSKR